MGAASRRAAPAWRSSCVALCLLPVALPLVLLCLPLLCVAVAVARFRRRRRRLLMITAAKNRSCCPGEPSPHEADGHRAALLHKYLEDQMELVGAAPAPGPGPATRTPPSPWTGRRARSRGEATRSSSSLGAERRSCSANWAQETELADLNI